MCTPVLAVVSAVATVGSAIMSANAQRQTANAQAQQITYEAQNNKAVADYNAQATENIASYNAQVAENNALVYERAAADSIQRGADAAAEDRLRTRQSNARGRAVAGASGTVVDYGTNLDLLVQNRQNGEMTALTTTNNAEREAYGYVTEAASERARAKGLLYTADLEAESIRLGGNVGLLNAQYGAANTRYAGKVGAQSTLITGATNFGQQVFSYGRDDIFERNAAKRNPFSSAGATARRAAGR